MDGLGLGNMVYRACQAKMSKLMLYQKEVYKLPYGSNKMERFVYKGEWANA